MIENLPGSQPSPQLMSLANLLLPSLMNRMAENMSNANDGKGGKDAKGKGGNLSGDADAKGKGSNLSGDAVSKGKGGYLFGDAVSGGASSSCQDPADPVAFDHSEAMGEDPGDAVHMAEGKGSKKKKSKKGKGKRAGKIRKY